MAISYTSEDNGIVKNETFTIGNTIQTTGSIPTTIFSYALSDGIGYAFTIESGLVNTNVDMAYTSLLKATHVRPVGGSATQIKKDHIVEKTNYDGGLPTVRTFADIATQSVKLEITGVAATTLTWRFNINIKSRSV